MKILPKRKAIFVVLYPVGGGRRVIFRVDVEDKTKLDKQDLFPLFRKHSQAIKQRNDAVNYYISRNSTELRDYHLTVGVVTCVAELVNNLFYRRIFCASYVSAEITFLSGIDLKEGSQFQF